MSSCCDQIFSANLQIIIYRTYLGYILSTSDPQKTILYLTRPNHRTAFVFWRFMVKNVGIKGCPRLKTKFFLQIFMELYRGRISNVHWVLPTNRKRSYTWPGPITAFVFLRFMVKNAQKKCCPRARNKSFRQIYIDSQLEDSPFTRIFYYKSPKHECRVEIGPGQV